MRPCSPTRLEPARHFIQALSGRPRRQRVNQRKPLSAARQNAALGDGVAICGRTRVKSFQASFPQSAICLCLNLQIASKIDREQEKGRQAPPRSPVFKPSAGIFSRPASFAHRSICANRRPFFHLALHRLHILHVKAEFDGACFFEGELDVAFPVLELACRIPMNMSGIRPGLNTSPPAGFSRTIGELTHFHDIANPCHFVKISTRLANRASPEIRPISFFAVCDRQVTAGGPVHWGRFAAGKRMPRLFEPRPIVILGRKPMVTKMRKEWRGERRIANVFHKF